MGILDRSVSSLGYVVGHAEQVYLVAEGAPSPPEIEEVSSSWQRSAKKHGVDPVDSSPPRILTQNELKDFREPLDKLIFSAQEEIDQLYKVVREAGYAALFCDSAGVAVEHRGENARASQFEYWGTWLGGVWSEEVEGTNGIGTCIVEERPITIHKSQHFRSRHINLSCSGAPVFGVDGRLVAVLDVSAIDPELSERAHALTGALTTKSARAIEERFFREQFHREWIVAVVPPEGQSIGMLLAVDGDQRIVGANRAARRTLLLDDRGAAGRCQLVEILRTKSRSLPAQERNRYLHDAPDCGQQRQLSCTCYSAGSDDCLEQCSAHECSHASALGLDWHTYETRACTASTWWWTVAECDAPGTGLC